MEFPFAEMVNNPWIKILSKYLLRRIVRPLERLTLSSYRSYNYRNQVYEWDGPEQYWYW